MVGLGAGEAFSFFFAGSKDDAAVLTENTKWAEFRLKDDLGTLLKTRFRFRGMLFNGRPNY